MLAKEEIDLAKRVISKLPGGTYTVRELFGDMWPVDHRPRYFGRRFKAAVIGGALPGVRWAGVQSNRSQLYEVGTVSSWDSGALGAGSRTGSRSPGRVGS